MNRCDHWRTLWSLALAGVILIVAAGCSRKPEKEESYVENAVSTRDTVEVDEGDAIPITYQALSGKWGLHYGGNYGYDFILASNYRAIIILYLNNQAIIFKGVMALEDEKTLRINIVESKNEHRVTGINLNHGFTRMKSSYFLFKARLMEKNKSRILDMRPVRIIIDGNDSEGYFEPIMKLKRL